MQKIDSIRNAQLLIERLGSDSSLLTRVTAARSYEEFLRVARDAGFDLSGLSEAEARGLVTGDRGALGELSQEDLDKVAGGGTQYWGTTDGKLTSQYLSPGAQYWSTNAAPGW